MLPPPSQGNAECLSVGVCGNLRPLSVCAEGPESRRQRLWHHESSGQRLRGLWTVKTLLPLSRWNCKGFFSIANIGSQKRLGGKKLGCWSFICRERPGFVPLEQTFLTLEIKSRTASLRPGAMLHTLTFEEPRDGDRFTSRKRLPGVSTLQHTTRSLPSSDPGLRNPSCPAFSQGFGLLMHHHSPSPGDRAWLWLWSCAWTAWGYGWQKLQLNLNRGRACGNRQGGYAYPCVCACPCARKRKPRWRLELGNRPTYSEPRCLVEGINWTRHPRPTPALCTAGGEGGRQAKFCAVCSASVLPFFWSPPPAFCHLQKRFLVGYCEFVVQIRWEELPEALFHPVSREYNKKVINLYISGPERNASSEEHCLNILFWPFPQAKLWPHSTKQTEKCCCPFCYIIYIATRPCHDAAAKCPLICSEGASHTG